MQPSSHSPDLHVVSPLNDPEFDEAVEAQKNDAGDGRRTSDNNGRLASRSKASGLCAEDVGDCGQNACKAIQKAWSMKRTK